MHNQHNIFNVVNETAEMKTIIPGGNSVWRYQKNKTMRKKVIFELSIEKRIQLDR